MHVWSLSKGGDGGGAGGSGCDDGWQLDVTSVWKVPNCHGGTSGQSRCRFGGTPDGRYIAAVRKRCAAGSCVSLASCCQQLTFESCVVQGNSKGDCYVFDAESGERVAHVSAIRVAGEGQQTAAEAFTTYAEKLPYLLTSCCKLLPCPQPLCARAACQMTAVTC